MKVTYTVVVALASLMMVGLTGCNEDNDAAAATQQGMAPLPVTVMKLQRRDVDLRTTWFGHLRGVNQADIRPEVSGKLLRQVYQDGSVCEEGEVLFEIDPSTYEAIVNQCEASVAVAKAAVEQAVVANETAHKDVERFGRLVGQGSVSEKTYTDAVQAEKTTVAALGAAKAQVKQAEAALETARLNLDRCTIRAPFTGLASKATVSKGDLISAGAVVLTSMSSVDPIRVDFVVPGKHMLNKNMSAGFDPSAGMVSPISEFSVVLEDGTTYTDASGEPVKGTVVAVDSEVNKASGTVNFIGQLPNPQLKLRSGSAVRVNARVGVEKDALLVPGRALVSAMNHRYIYVVGADKEPHGIDVQLGEEVVLDMPNGDGTTVPMLMQVVKGTVKPIAESLKEFGIENPDEAEVIVEGGQMAAIYAQANAMMRTNGAPGGFGIVVPRPFIYTQPKTTTPSVTAKQGNTDTKGE